MKALLRALAVAPLLIAACGSAKDAQFSSNALDAAIRTAPAVDATAIRPFVEELVARRGFETPLLSLYSERQGITHVNSLAIVTEKLTALGYAPVFEPFGDGALAGTNLYVDLPGDTPELVIVSGHHDAWFQSGADDNGSALAVIIETARALRGQHFRRTVRLIAFDREEEGLLGAQAYTDKHAGDRIRMVLNMDCVGYASHEAGSQDAPTGFALRDRGDFIAVLANGPARADATRMIHVAAQLPMPVDVVGLLTPGDSDYPGVGAFLRSDHAHFWFRGIPALFVTDTADFRNHHYHTPDDQPDTLDYDFLNRVAQLVAGSAAAFAEAE